MRRRESKKNWKLLPPHGVRKSAVTSRGDPIKVSVRAKYRIALATHTIHLFPPP